MRDGRIVEVMEVVGVEGSRVLFERFLPLHDTVLKRYRVANAARSVFSPSRTRPRVTFLTACWSRSAAAAGRRVPCFDLRVSMARRRASPPPSVGARPCARSARFVRLTDIP